MKECFENDQFVLKQSFDSDIKLAETLNLLISVHIAKIWDVLELKGLITEEEKIQFLQEVREKLEKERRSNDDN